MLETISNDYQGLYNSYYQRIKEEVMEIKEKFEYEKKSQAFAHWYLYNIEGINENIVEEAITDGHNDWGIDAIIINYDTDRINLYQFKFPDKEDNISKKIAQEDISSFLRGYKFCSSGKAPTNANEDLVGKIAEIDESNIFSFKLTFVSYTDGLSETAEITLNEELEKIKGTGNTLEWVLLDKKEVTDIIYEKGKLQEDYTITLTQHGTSTGVLMDEDSNTYTIHASLRELADLSEKYQNIIFDENVRLFHGVDNKFNQGIIGTASGSDVNHFHLYNNGIVIVSPKVVNAEFRKIIKIDNPMVVNGCQTMNSLLEAKKQGVLNDGLVQVTIIEITDPIIKQNISIFLNSQTEIKDSYLISNLPIIRTLENDLSKLGYFFERQANKLGILKKRLSRKEKTKLLGVNNSKAIELDLAIQLQASFYENLAPVAKLNKAKLFEKKHLETILKNINAERVAFAFEIYNKFMEKISDYRSYKRNKKNRIILKYLGIKAKEISDYSFLNTGDFFLISTFAAISQKRFGKLPAIGEKGKVDFTKWTNQVLASFDEIFKESVQLMYEGIKEDKTGKQIATLTKSQAFHKVLMQKVNERYKSGK
ncbi:AIPR family protein [Radiobacillus kanasensis]|uniref:AIPR family protein n=1 Tax=Radiobacillus kanasensis TaxID=2844358 RepID=UPI001E28FBA0|nr:AIPR family protein [Radiobacillus kanasensis]UFU00168.1 AIPR family protein [Radiobacillus kanasensis]